MLYTYTEHTTTTTSTTTKTVQITMTAVIKPTGDCCYPLINYYDVQLQYMLNYYKTVTTQTSAYTATVV